MAKTKYKSANKGELLCREKGGSWGIGYQQKSIGGEQEPGIVTVSHWLSCGIFLSGKIIGLGAGQRENPPPAGVEKWATSGFEL